MSLKLYHNPRCSKSREALRLLREHGAEPEVVLYLETPPSPREITDILRRLGMRARDLMRAKEPLFEELGLDNEALSDAALVKAMAANPVLIERPIAICGDRAAVGRPPENVLNVLARPIGTSS